MSKVVTSEFDKWESLYWPESIPRKLEHISSSQILSKLGNDFRLISTRYLVDRPTIDRMAQDLIAQIGQDRKKECLFVLRESGIGILIALLVSLRTQVSLTIGDDQAKMKTSVELKQVGTSGSPLADFIFETRHAEGVELAPEPRITISANKARVVYSTEDFTAAGESFGAFMSLSKGLIAVVGPPKKEFEFCALTASIFSGASVLICESLSELDQNISQVTGIFIGQEMIDSERGASEVLRLGTEKLRARRDSVRFIGVQWPAKAEFTKRLEKIAHIPVLQMLGISGRGIAFCNPEEFNVHGSTGIPITNVESVIADNYEGNWVRERVLMGPGTEGEVLIRGSFINPKKKTGNPKQRSVAASIGGQSTQWISTGIMATMDENGFIYPSQISVR